MGEFFHGMITGRFGGNPCVKHRGAVIRGGLFWFLFLAVVKEELARGAKTAMPETSSIEIKDISIQ